MDYIDKCKKLVDEKYPTCDGALLAGSFVRGDATETSDFDLIIFFTDLKNAYRESYIYDGTPIEVFIHNKSSIEYYFEQDASNKVLSLQNMILESIVIRESELVEYSKALAEEYFNRGPGKLTESQIKSLRYAITDKLDDLIGSNDGAETFFIANDLVDTLHRLYLLSNNKWLGKGKWIIRAVRRANPDMAHKFERALEMLKKNDKEALVNLTDEILEPFGGRLFEGFTMGKSDF